MAEVKSHFLAIVVTLLVAGAFISATKLSGVINPLSLTLLRFVIAVTILIPFILLKKNHRAGVLTAFPRSIVMSFFFSIFFICMFEALNTTTALNTGTLYTSVPLITATLSIFAFKIKMTKEMIFVYVLGAMGTCWVIFRGNLDTLLDFSFNLGDALFIVGCISMSCYSISMKWLYRDDVMVVLVFTTLLCGVFWLSLALLISGKPLEWNLLHEELWIHMAYLALFATLASTLLVQKATVVLGPTRVMAYIYLSPVFVAILMLTIEDQSLPQMVYPGMILSLSATIILQIMNRQPQRLA